MHFTAFTAPIRHGQVGPGLEARRAKVQHLAAEPGAVIAVAKISRMARVLGFRFTAKARAM